jgi:ABC-2 type transport system ATP-binding protein
MKCELIAALLHKPKVLFLDEPTIGLDVVAQHNIRHFIKEYNRKEKTTILLTSHYMEDIKELCKRVIIIDLGKIIYDGNLDTFIRHYAPYKVLKLTFNDPGVKREDVDHFGQIESFSPLFIAIKVEREKTTAIAQQILSSNQPVNDTLIDEIDVDDVIRKIFRKE